MTSCASSRCTIPRMACRVVCGLLDVIATLVPTSALVSVDLPALGRPTKQANPERWTLAGLITRSFLPNRRTRAEAAAYPSWSQPGEEPHGRRTRPHDAPVAVGRNDRAQLHVAADGGRAHPGGLGQR